MGMAYTRMDPEAFQHLVLNAGILANDFEPETGTVSGLLGVTTGGITFAMNPEYEDFAEDIDQAPNNMMEFKRLVSLDPTISGNFAELGNTLLEKLIGPASSEQAVGGFWEYSLTNNLGTMHFSDVWWIGDYSEINTGSNAGFLAIHLKHALNTTGFQITATKNAKAQFAFEWHAHYSINSPDTIPLEIFLKMPTSQEANP